MCGEFLERFYGAETINARKSLILNIAMDFSFKGYNGGGVRSLKNFFSFANINAPCAMGFECALYLIMF